MLMLSRRIGESITLQTSSGEQIRVTISHVRGNLVSVGIDAPKDVIIARNELLKPVKINPRAPDKLHHVTTVVTNGGFLRPK